MHCIYVRYSFFSPSQYLSVFVKYRKEKFILIVYRRENTFVELFCEYYICVFFDKVQMFICVVSLLDIYMYFFFSGIMRPMKMANSDFVIVYCSVFFCIVYYLYSSLS